MFHPPPLRRAWARVTKDVPGLLLANSIWSYRLGVGLTIARTWGGVPRLRRLNRRADVRRELAEAVARGLLRPIESFARSGSAPAVARVRPRETATETSPAAARWLRTEVAAIRSLPGPARS